MVAAKVKQRREKHVKNVISAKAKQRLAKHVKYKIFAHTRQSLEKLVKHVPFPAQKKENDVFSFKTSVKYCGLREDEQRLEKLVKYVLFVKAEPRLKKHVKGVPFEHQKTLFGGPSRAFSWKN